MQCIKCPICTSERVFPPVTPQLYDCNNNAAALTPDKEAGRFVLTLSRKKFRFWQYYSKTRMDVTGEIGRLLFYHRMAMSAELVSQWKRANFFWQEMHKHVISVFRTGTSLKALSEILYKMYPEIDIFMNPVQIQRHLVNEIFINTHCAFLNGYLNKTNKANIKDQVLLHFRYLMKLLPLSLLNKKEKFSLLDSSSQGIIALLAKEKYWEEAINICKRTLEYDKENVYYQNKLIDLHFSETVSKVRKENGENRVLTEIRYLMNGIQQLEKIRRYFPYNLFIYNKLGYLYYLHAAKLHNVGRLSKALVEVQKALIFHPGMEEAEKTKLELVKKMEELRMQIPPDVDYYSQYLDVYISKEEQELREEAKTGFTPLEKYIDSPEAHNAKRDLLIARACDLWQKIGLVIPEEKWHEKAVYLLNVLSPILKNYPENHADLYMIWQEKVARDKILRNLDSALIYIYLAYWFFKDSKDENPILTKRGIHNGLSHKNPGSSIEISNHSIHPSILIPKRSMKQKGIPFLCWLFNGEKKFLKNLTA